MLPRPPTPGAPDAGWLLRELTDARVASPDRLGPAIDRFRVEVGTDDASALADFLVVRGVLTPLQAEWALAGDAGKLVLGPFLLTHPLGAGGMGVVYRATGRTDGQPYAVKVLPLRSLWNVHLAKRQVAAFAALPPHPAVIPLKAIDSAAGCHYLAWPLRPGETLDRRVARDGPAPPAVAAQLLADAADGLAGCHAHGIVHGLLKPSNLLVGPDGTVRLLDLGVGAVLSENLADDETMFDTISTANGALGMMDCAAPETLAHPTLRTPAGDSYSLGCVLYYLLTGSYPFPDGNAVDKILAHQTQEPAPVRARNPAVPEPLAGLVSRLMRKRPDDRPEMAAAAAELRAAADAAPPPADDPPVVVLAPAPPTPPPKPPPPLVPKPASRPLLPAVPGSRPAWNPGAGRGADVIDFDLPDDPDDQSAPGEAAFVPPPKPARPHVHPTPPPAPALPPGPRPSRVPPVKVVPPPAPAFRLVRVGWRAARTVFPWLAPRDVVQVSVFGPPDARAGASTGFQVFAHPPGEFAAARTLARAAAAGCDLLAAGFADRLVPRGRTLRVELWVADPTATRSEIDVVWDGSPRAAGFAVRLPTPTPPGQHPGEVVVTFGGRPAAWLPFQLGVTMARAG